MNAYGVKAGLLIPLVDKRVGGRQNCVIPQTRAIPECIRGGYDDALHKSTFTLLYKFEVDTTIRCRVSALLLLIRHVALCFKVANQVASVGEHQARYIYTQDGRLELRSVSYDIALVLYDFLSSIFTGALVFKRRA